MRKRWPDFLRLREAAKSLRHNGGLQKYFETDADVVGLDMETYVTTYIHLNSGWATYLKITRSVGTTPPNAKQTSYKDEVWILTK